MTDEPRTGDAPATSGASLEERLAKAEADAQKYLDNWRRAEADFQNFKKRSEQERDELRRFSSGALIINLLPIVDDFERAFSSIDSHLAGLTWLDGMRLIYRKLVMLLENAGVKPIPAEGQPFDPRVHEAVAHVDGEEGKVLSEVQRGYMLHDRVLRPAMVVVGKGTGDRGQGTGEQGEGETQM
jgi:molecular chaperone GrpE